MFGFKRNKDDAADKAQEEAAPPRLIKGLKRTRTGLFAGLFQRNKKLKLDSATLEELEDHLLIADVGMRTTDQVMQALRDSEADENAEPVAVMKQVLLPVLEQVQQPLKVDTDNTPFLILVVGVNGVGKTTTIGKLAKRLQHEGKKVMLAAGDTFRAAAVEQLQVWGERNNIKVVSQGPNADSGAVIYDALESARANNIDVLIADTAGRLHTKDNLMAEMKKIHRIGDKFDPNMPREVLLVLDAGTGQNALVQARQFNESVGITGIVLTKLDGTAKGGIIFSLATELSIPIRFIGVGEQIEDLREFNAHDFIDALLEMDDAT